MKGKKRTAIVLCAVVLAVSFVHPFSGGISYAESTVEGQAETVSSGKTAKDTEEKADGSEKDAKTEENTGKGAVKKEIAETERADIENVITGTEKNDTEMTGKDKTEEDQEKETEQKDDGDVSEGTEEETDGKDTERTEDNSPEEDGQDVGHDTENREEQDRIRSDEDTELPVPADMTETDSDIEGTETETDRVFPVRRAAARSMGISASDPQAGQENSYGCTNGVQIWTAPASGKYRIACYGGAGGDQQTPGDTIAAGNGSIRQGTIRLEKGTVLYLHVGGDGAGGNRRSHGDEEGNDGGYNGGAGAGYDTNDLGNHGRYWTHGAGGGASDIRLGGNGLDDQIMVAGGGGGANKDNVGRNADSGSYNGRRLNGSYEGGGGGYYGGNANQGGSSYVNTAYFTDIVQSNGNSLTGQIVIRIVSLFPRVRLTAPGEWTREDVVIRGEILLEGEGCPEEYLSWEKTEEGEDIWTADDTWTVSQNGTYRCRIRDIEGNTTEEAFTVKNIDRLKPLVEKIEASETDWTREAVTLTIHAEDAEATTEYGCSGLAEKAYLWGMRKLSGETVWGLEGEQEEADRQEPSSDWTDKNTITVSENGIYLCKVRDTAGNVEETAYTVKNMDRTPPRLTYRQTEKWYEGSTSVILEVSDLQPDLTPGCGPADQPFSKDGVTFDNSRTLRIEKEGTYYIWVKDRLGNTGKERIVLMHDTRESGKKKKTETLVPAPVIPPVLLTEEEPLPADEPGTEGPVTATEDMGLPVKEEPEKKRGAETALPVLMTDLQEETVQEPGEIQRKLPVMQEQPKERPAADNMERQEPAKAAFNWKRAALYSVWTVAVLCGLLWLLFCLIFEHVTVYRKDEKGNYRRAGRCAIVRRKDYKQINLLHLMKKGEDRDYKVCFAGIFVLLHRKEKVMIRTWYGVELRHIEKEIEINHCNSGDHMLT